jgi:dihydroflavonol-4-reductase
MRTKHSQQKVEIVSIVLVTGGSGFVGSHIIFRLLEDGHQVRTTVRNAGKEAAVREMVRNGGWANDEGLVFFQADLTDDRGWDAAVAGCDYVLHVASPFPRGRPKDENELIAPARDGTLRVLRAARDAGVKRVVLTSSFAAIGYGHGAADRIFNEEDWTDITGAGVQPYIKSKTIAERAAWDFIAREGGGLELSVINPVGVFGPVLGGMLGGSLSNSIAIIKQLVEGMPAVPRIYFGMVDVRDLAELHARAMLAEAAQGQRFIAVGGGVVSLFEVASILRRRLGASASRVPTRQFPDWVLRFLALFSPAARGALPQLGIIRRSTSDKARRLLGWRPRSYEEMITDTAESLIHHGILGAR